jgi:hypothetical protein
MYLYIFVLRYILIFSTKDWFAVDTQMTDSLSILIEFIPNLNQRRFGTDLRWAEVHGGITHEKTLAMCRRGLRFIVLSVPLFVSIFQYYYCVCLQAVFLQLSVSLIVDFVMQMKIVLRLVYTAFHLEHYSVFNAKFIMFVFFLDCKYCNICKVEC